MLDEHNAEEEDSGDKDPRGFPTERLPDPETNAAHRAPNEADTTRSMRSRNRGRLPLSAKRWRLAQSFVTRGEKCGGYYTFREDMDVPREPQDLEVFKDFNSYDPDLHRYFNFRIDYFPGYEAKASLLDWNARIWFADINDEMMEAKFPRDMSLRACISAYHITVRKNQATNIRRKRLFQFAGSFAMLTPALALAFFQDALLPRTFTAGGQKALFSTEPLSLAFFGVLALFLVIGFLVTRVTIGITTTHMTSAFRGNAKDLNAKLQRRMNTLRQNYTRFYKAIAEEEFSGRDSDGAEWTDRAKWWARLAMWMPKRIEYLEKFLQSEMQRIRVFRIWTDALGNLSATLTWLACAVAILIVAQISGVSSAPFLAAAITGLSGSALLAVMSTQAKFSLDNKLIRRWIGDDDWPRFSGIGLDVDFGEIIRRDKDRIRQEKLRGGGFGQN